MSIQGERIKELRNKMGLSQMELAIACGYKSRTAIANIEAGKSLMNYPRLKKCAKELGTNADYLAGKNTDDKRAASQDAFDEAYFELRKFTFNSIVSKGSERIVSYWNELSEDDQTILLECAEVLLACDKEGKNHFKETINYILKRNQ